MIGLGLMMFNVLHFLQGRKALIGLKEGCVVTLSMLGVSFAEKEVLDFS